MAQLATFWRFPIIVLEEQKNAILKDSSDLRNNLREVEKSRLEARRELQELRRQIKMLDSESKKKSQEVVDLQVSRNWRPNYYHGHC